MKKLKIYLIAIFTILLTNISFAMETPLDRYLNTCKEKRVRPVMIVACGHHSHEGFGDDLTFMQPHQHIGHNFYVDCNPKVKPDLVGNFLELDATIIPDGSFQTIYFEYMTNHMRGKAQEYFEAAFRLLQPGGMIAFEGTLVNESDCHHYKQYTDALRELGFVNVRMGWNTFNDRTENREMETLIMATRHKKELFALNP